MEKKQGKGTARLVCVCVCVSVLEVVVQSRQAVCD